MTKPSEVARESQHTLELPWHRNGLAVESDERYVASFDSRGANDEHDDEQRLEFAIQACNAHTKLVEALTITLAALTNLAKQLPTDERLADYQLDFAETASFQAEQALRLAQGEK